MYYVYVLKSKHHKQIYIGSTADLRKRLEEHNNGINQSTKRYKPWELMYYEAYRLEKLARLREKRLKYHGNALRELKKRIGLFSLPRTSYPGKSGAGFTLMETLIVISIIAILAIIAIVLLNPQKQINKAWDAQRKYDLATLQKVFEDFYNDKERYPIDTDVCYDAKTGPDAEGICSCFICGKESASPLLKPYIKQLSCDPEHPKKRYLYQYRCTSALISGEFQLNASLSDAAGPNEYNYNVSVPNALPTPTTGTGPQQPSTTPTPIPPTVTLPTPTPLGPSCPSDPNIKYCLSATTCNLCGTFANCNSPGNCNQPLQLYSNLSCTDACSQ